MATALSELLSGGGEEQGITKLTTDQTPGTEPAAEPATTPAADPNTPAEVPAVTPPAATDPTTPEVTTPEVGTGDENPGNPDDFWNSVDELSGDPVTVEYGAVDRSSPEGILLRDKAIAARAELRFEEYLEKTNPRGYAYLCPSSAGKPDEEFFQTKIPALPAYDVFKNNIDLQLDIYKRDLLNSGRDPDEVEILVKSLEKQGAEAIFKKSDAVYQRSQSAINEQLAKVKAQMDREQAEFTRKVQEVQTTLSSTVTGNKLNIQIPEVDRTGFLNFITDAVREQDGQFFLVQPLDKEKMNLLTEAMYYMYKGGDLSKLVQRKATTLLTSQRKALVDQAKVTITATPATTKKPTVADIT